MEKDKITALEYFQKACDYQMPGVEARLWRLGREPRIMVLSILKRHHVPTQNYVSVLSMVAPSFVASDLCCVCHNLSRASCPCETRRYCGRECQLNDWKVHKSTCAAKRK